MVVDRTRIHRILVIKLRAIGDVLLSTVVLNNLRKAFPDAHIDFCAEVSGGEIIEGHPAIDSRLIFDAKKESGLSLIRRVRAGNYDCIIDLFGNPRSAVVTLLSGARYRVGYRFGWRRCCYNIVTQPRGNQVHNRDFNLDALTMIGVAVPDTSLTITVPDDARDFARKFFRDEGLDGAFVVALNAGGGWYTKRWGTAHFAALADEVIERHKAEVIICWGPGEKQSAEELLHSMKRRARLIPSTSLKQLAAILSLSSVVITNDSGPMHIAAVMGTPVLAVFGPTNPRFQGPVGDRNVVVRNERLDCLGCNLTKCPIGLPCMKELNVEEVLKGFQRLLPLAEKNTREKI